MPDSMTRTTAPARVATGPFDWICPSCRTPLRVERSDVHCTTCGTTYEYKEKIWDLLPARRAAAFAPFREQYQTVRGHEGWGSDDPGYYRALPNVPPDDPHGDIWRVRRRSFDAFVRRVVVPMETRRDRPLRVVDLGAGNGWLAHRLARRGHDVAAVDLQMDAWDGLGACRHYDTALWPARAEFDHLPFGDAQFDLAVFNGSLHYATDYAVTLGEVLRVLRYDGAVALLDSPCYPDAESGHQMVREREDYFSETFGFASRALDSEGFLTEHRLHELAAELDLTWERHAPFYGWRWMLRPWWARLRGRRPPASFGVFVGRRRAFMPARRPLHRRAARWLWRVGLRWRFRLFQQHRHDRLVTETVAGQPIVVLPQVFNPVLFRTGAFLARALKGRIPPGSAVLDMGTGSGIGAVFAALEGADVDAVDINPHAVHCARINALRHEVDDRVDIHHGDLFESLGGRRYDVVLFNPPYFRGTPRDALDQAWRSDGVVERFAARVRDHLTPDGFGLVVLSSDGDAVSFLAAFHLHGFTVTIEDRADRINEIITLYRLTPR